MERKLEEELKQIKEDVRWAPIREHMDKGVEELEKIDRKITELIEKG